MEQRRLAFDAPGKRKKWVPEAPPSLAGIDVIGWDTETTGLKWWDKNHHIGTSISYGGKLQYIPTRHVSENIDHDTWLRWAKTELVGKTLVGTNLKFDAQIYLKEGVDLEAQGCKLWDVGHGAALLDDNRRSFSLENISQDMLGRGKVEGLDKRFLADLPGGDVAHYAEVDVELPMLLRDKMLPQLQEQDLMMLQQLESDLIWVTCEMERNAVNLDMDLLHQYINQSEQELNGLLYKIHEITGVRVNPRSPADSAVIFDRLQIFRPPDFQAETLGKFDHPVVKMLVRCRQLESLRSKFLINYLEQVTKDPHGLLRYALHQLACDEGGTVSGRYSSSALLRGLIGVNIQQVSNVKKQIKKYNSKKYIIRQLFVPGSGLWVSADAMQIEYRLFGHYSNSPKITQAYKENPLTDFHQLLTEVLQTKKPAINRDRTKDVNFAYIYGAGVPKFALMVGISEDEAREIRAIYNDLMPEVPILLRKAQETAEQRGYVKTLFGRRARFPGGKFAHKAFNRIDQGSAADIMKSKLVELHKERKRTNFKLRFTLHDAVDGDVPDQESANMVKEILDRQTVAQWTGGKPLRVPILWDVKTGANWAEAA